MTCDWCGGSGKDREGFYSLSECRKCNGSGVLYCQGGRPTHTPDGVPIIQDDEDGWGAYD